MKEYKVVIRHTSDDADGALCWEEGCPVEFKALQVSRDTANGAAFLQARIENLGVTTVTMVKLGFIVHFRDGSEQSIKVDMLDADIPGGGNREMPAQKLDSGDVISVDSLIVETSESGTVWTTSCDVIPRPRPKKLGIKSPEALAELKRQLEESGVKPCAADGAAEKHKDWWLCGCGRINIGWARCPECNARPDSVSALADECKLNEAAKKRSAKAAKKRSNAVKLGVIVGGAFAVILIAAFAWSNIIEPSLPRGAYVVSSVIDGDEKEKLVIDERGNIVQESWAGETVKYEIDEKTGFPTKCHVPGSKGNSYTQEITEVDKYNRPTAAHRIYEDGDESYVYMGYKDDGKLAYITERRVDGIDVIIHYDDEGYQIDNRISEDTYDNYEWTNEYGNLSVDVILNDKNYGTQNYSYSYDENGNVSKVSHKGEYEFYEYAYIEDCSPWAYATAGIKPYESWVLR